MSLALSLPVQFSLSYWPSSEYLEKFFFDTLHFRVPLSLPSNWYTTRQTPKHIYIISKGRAYSHGMSNLRSGQNGDLGRYWLKHLEGNFLVHAETGMNRKDTA